MIFMTSVLRFKSRVRSCWMLPITCFQLLWVR